MQPRETAHLGQAMLTMQKSPVVIVDDAVVLTVTCDTHTLNIDPASFARVRVQFALNLEDGRKIILNRFAKDLLDRTREWLDLIYGGENYANAQLAARANDNAIVATTYKDLDGVERVARLPFMDAHLP